MRFTIKQERYSKPYWIGVKDRFIFTYTTSQYGYYVTVNHRVKDIRYNSLWEQIVFKTGQEAEQWCIDFDYRKFKCLGNDV